MPQPFNHLSLLSGVGIAHALRHPTSVHQYSLTRVESEGWDNIVAHLDRAHFNAKTITVAETTKHLMGIASPAQRNHTTSTWPSTWVDQRPDLKITRGWSQLSPWSNQNLSWVVKFSSGRNPLIFNSFAFGQAEKYHATSLILLILTAKQISTVIDNCVMIQHLLEWHRFSSPNFFIKICYQVKFPLAPP